MNPRVPIGDQSQIYDITDSETDYVLEQGTTIDSQNDGIDEDAEFHGNTIDIEGTISATRGGTTAISSSGAGTHIVVGSTGAVDGNWGILADGDFAKIVNYGQIKGEDAAVLLHSEHGKFVNHGDIKGQVQDELGHGSVVLAHGSTLTDNVEFALTAETADGQAMHIVNRGTVSGAHGAIAMDGGDETLINRGTINGDVRLGTGNDVFDNRGGTFHSEDGVDGGAGNDVFFLDKKTAVEEGTGGGTDTIKSTVSMSLSNNVLADQEIENLALLGHKDSTGIGNDLANALTGNAGDNKLLGLANNDMLDGGSGNDHLDGGVGRDMLTGGAGDDVFVFKTGYEQDTVTDFESGHDHFDFSGWSEIKGFNDLMQHHLTVSGDSLIIQAGVDTMIIEHVQKGQLDASDFTFA
jgi:Ca2+-binding RTX toxin-like protein